MSFTLAMPSSRPSSRPKIIILTFIGPFREARLRPEGRDDTIYFSTFSLKYSIAWTIGPTIPALIIGCDPIINLIILRGRGRGSRDRGVGSKAQVVGSGRVCPTWLPVRRLVEEMTWQYLTQHFISLALLRSSFNRDAFSFSLSPPF